MPKFKNSIYQKIQTMRFLEEMAEREEWSSSNDCSGWDLFCISSKDISPTRYFISYTQYNDNRETRRLTIDLLRYRVEREFPSLERRTSQCDSHKVFYLIFIIRTFMKRGYSQSLLFLIVNWSLKMRQI